MRLFTADEIKEIVDAFFSFKTGDDQREQLDYFTAVQAVASTMKTFLDEHTKPKPRTFFGLFGTEEE